jgi:hypothetical protein
MALEHGHSGEERDCVVRRARPPKAQSALEILGQGGISRERSAISNAAKPPRPGKGTGLDK